MRVSSYFVVFFILLLGASCSVKEESEAVAENPSRILPLTTVFSTDKDLDQDGLSNELEESLERDPRIGDFPRFSISSLRHTQIKLKDLARAGSEVVVEYNTYDNVNYNIKYNPVRDKVAKASYRRVIGKVEPAEPIGIFDFGTLKLSNFNEEQLQEIQSIINGYDGHDAIHTVSLNSIFTLKVEMMKGIVKLYDVKGELGFIDEKGAFNSFGPIFDVLSTDRTRIIFNSDGLDDSSTSNMEVMIHLDRLEVSDLQDVLENNYDLAFKVHNYKADTAEKKIIEYTDQVKRALEVGVLFAVSSNDNDYLFFNSQTENIEKTLERLLGPIDSDSEGTIVGIGHNVTNTDFPIVFEAGGNNHLRQSSWHLFSEKSKIDDIPRKSGTVMLGFFTNRELASSNDRLILKSKSNVVSSVDLACSGSRVCIGALSSSGIVTPESTPIQLNNLNVGELVEIKVSGKNYRWGPDQIQTGSVKIISSYLTCPNNRYPRPEINSCRRVSNNRQCSYTRRNRVLKTEDLSALSIDSLFKSISLESIDKSRMIHFSERELFNLHRPVYKKDHWLISFYVSEDTISKYGESLTLNFPKIGGRAFRSGFLGFNEEDCDKMTQFSDEYQRDSLVWNAESYDDTFLDNSGDTLRNYKVDIVRQFKNINTQEL